MYVYMQSLQKSSKSVNQLRLFEVILKDNLKPSHSLISVVSLASE